MVRAWHHTYGLPVIITNCSNNYGPYQNPEKLNPPNNYECIHRQEIPVYGDGSQIRDWLYVEDHAEALIEVIDKGKIGEKYCIGGNEERSNNEIAEIICNHFSKSKK